MDVWNFIRREHTTIEELFAELLATTAGGAVDRDQLFHELRMQLAAHTEMEENVFYPALTKNARASGFLAGAIDEHEREQGLLTELSVIPVLSRLWIETLQTLRHAVHAHIKKEESELLPVALIVIPGGQTQQRLLHRMAVEKKRYLEARL
jgi:iron-sulfur cluster repair protein YtfE (RIC family)